ncbi:MAG: 30S ribosomal protein S19 [Planctomycetota bacterium]|jgi:small subunit ribosomal protein S19
MSRSSKKGPAVVPKLLRKVMKQKDTHSQEPIKTWARACTVVPEFVDHTFLVHNGKTFVKVYVVEDMVGHKLGEFAPTRRFGGHAGKKDKRRR